MGSNWENRTKLRKESWVMGILTKIHVRVYLSCSQRSWGLGRKIQSHLPHLSSIQTLPNRRVWGLGRFSMPSDLATE